MNFPLFDLRAEASHRESSRSQNAIADTLKRVLPGRQSPRCILLVRLPGIVHDLLEKHVALGQFLTNVTL